MLRLRLDLGRHGSAGYTSYRRVAAIGMGFVFLILGLKLSLQVQFDGRILPGVVVANRQVGGLMLNDARKLLRDDVAKYRLRMTVAGDKYELTASQLGVAFDSEATAENAYRIGRRGWLPSLHQDPLMFSYRLDRSQLNAFATSVAVKVGTPPVDAVVTVNGTDFSTVPEKSGWSIDRMGLERLIEDDLRRSGGGVLSLKPREQLADIQVKRLEPTFSQAKQLMAVPIVLSYVDKTYTPRPADIGKWLTFEKQPDGLAYKLVPKIDTPKLKSYVQSLANDLDVDPVVKKVIVENGVTKVQQEGVEGTAINQDELTKRIAEAINAQQPLTYTITSHTVPFKTISTTLVSLDYGRYIEVNLSKQHLWVWQDHAVIYDTPITSGATGAGLGTATGLFAVYYKTTNTRLRGYQYGYSYDVPVKYWMPFYKGYGLHDAEWRHGNFGGSDYYYGGSHGCVNLPDAAAEFIYNWAEIGTPVWVHT